MITVTFRFKGGTRSGNFGHAGRPGKIGGSSGGGGTGGSVSPGDMSVSLAQYAAEGHAENLADMISDNARAKYNSKTGKMDIALHIGGESPGVQRSWKNKINTYLTENQGKKRDYRSFTVSESNGVLNVALDYGKLYQYSDD